LPRALPLSTSAWARRMLAALMRLATLISGLEQGHLGPDFADDSGRVPAEDFRLSRESSGAYLSVDRVDRHGFDLDQKLPGPRAGFRHKDVLKRRRVFDRQAFVDVTDRSHRHSLLNVV